jgi:hypothetical protein
MPDTTLPNDLERLIRRAQAQPGVSELMKIYGRYDEVIEQYRAYTEGRIEQPHMVLSNKTS